MCCAKDGGFSSLLAEILALLRPHVLGSAGLRPHFCWKTAEKRAHIQNQAHTFKTTEKRAHIFKTTFLSRE